MPKTRLLLILIATVGALGAGCGGDDEPSTGRTETQEAAEATATPAKARAEIGEVRALLRTAVSRYRQGDRRGAEQLVGDAYLEHFEEVEGPLEARNHELMEELEVAISTELRDQIKRGAPQAQVERLVARINADLDRAEAALR